MSSRVYQGQPPCDPKTLGVRLDQRREIGAWIHGKQHLANLRRKDLLPKLRNAPQSVDLVGCSASNFADSAGREMKCALPQRAPVLELDCICKLLFLNENEASPKFSCNI